VRINAANVQLEEPITVKEAISGPDEEKWLEVMENQMRSLRENDIYELVELKFRWKQVGFIKIKTAADSSMECYKACLIAQCFSQNSGLTMMKLFVQ